MARDIREPDCELTILSPEDNMFTELNNADKPCTSKSSAVSHPKDDLLSNPWPYLNNFFGPLLTKEIVIRKGKQVIKGTIKCKSCKAVLSFSTISMFSLKRHYQNVSN